MKEIFDQGLLHFHMKAHELDKLFDKDIQKEMKLYQLNKGELLCSNGDKLENMYFLVDGKLKIYTTLPNGKSLLLRFNNPLEILGDIEFANQYEVKVNVESVYESLLIGVSLEELSKSYYDNPAHCSKT